MSVLCLFLCYDDKQMVRLYKAEGGKRMDSNHMMEKQEKKNGQQSQNAQQVGSAQQNQNIQQIHHELDKYTGNVEMSWENYDAVKVITDAAGNYLEIIPMKQAIVEENYRILTNGKKLSNGERKKRLKRLDEYKPKGMEALELMKMLNGEGEQYAGVIKKAEPFPEQSKSWIHMFLDRRNTKEADESNEALRKEFCSEDSVCRYEKYSEILKILKQIPDAVLQPPEDYDEDMWGFVKRYGQYYPMLQKTEEIIQYMEKDGYQPEQELKLELLAKANLAAETADRVKSFLTVMGNTFFHFLTEEEFKEFCQEAGKVRWDALELDEKWQKMMGSSPEFKKFANAVLESCRVWDRMRKEQEGKTPEQLIEDEKNRLRSKTEEWEKMSDEEKEERRENRRIYLRTGTVNGMQRKDWELGDYEELIQKEYGDELYALDEYNDFARTLERKNQIVQVNRIAVERYLEQYIQKAGRGVLKNTKMHDRCLESLQNRLRSGIFSMEEEELSAFLQTEGDKEITKTLTDISEELIPYEKRYEKLEEALKPLLHAEKLWEEQAVSELLDQDMEEAAFDEKLALLKDRISWNLEIVEECIRNDSRFHYHFIHESILKSLIEKNGSRFLTLKAREVQVLTKYFLNGDREGSKAVEKGKKQESRIQRLMKENGIHPYWGNTVFSVLDEKGLLKSGTEKEEFQRAVTALAETIKKNESIYISVREKYKGNIEEWERLEQWFVNSVQTEHDEFVQKLGELVNGDAADQATQLNYKEYLYGKRETLKTQASSNRAKMLVKAELCGFEAFGKELDGYEDVLMHTVETMLREKRFQSLPYMEEINKLDDLQYLTKGQYSRLLVLLRSNLLTGFEKWKNVDGVYKEEIRRELLPAILTGELLEEDFDGKVKELQQKKVDIEKIRKMRFLVTLGTQEEQQSKAIRYHYTRGGERQKYFGFSKTSRPEQRKKHCLLAESVWEKVREQGKEIEFLKQCRDSSPDTIYQELKRLLDKKMELPEKSRFIHEFMLCGMEGEVFSTGGVGAQVFLSGKTEQYENETVRISRWIAERKLGLEAFFNEKCQGMDQNEIEKLRIKMSRLLAGLEPLTARGEEKNIRLRNLSRLGVESWDQALGLLEDYLEGRKQSGMAELDDKGKFHRQAEEAAELYNRRKGELERYEKGLFAPILAKLLENEKIWSACMLENDQEFEKTMKELEQQIGVPMRALQDKTEPYFYDQFIMEFGDKILNEMEASQRTQKEEWEKLFKDYDDDIFLRKHAGVSINDRIEKFEKKYSPELFASVMNYIYKEKTNAILYDDEELDAELKKYQNRIKENREAIDGYMQTRGRSWTKKKKTEFERFIAPKLYTELALQSPNFWNDLMQEFDLFERSVKRASSADVDAIQKDMEKKQKYMAEIEKQKQKGREAVWKHREALGGLYSYSVKGNSPILASLGAEEMTDELLRKTEKKVIKTQNKVTGESFSEDDAFIRNFRIELQLSKQPGLDSKEVISWLVKTRKQIKSKLMAGEKNPDGISASEADAFSIFLFLQKEKKDLKDKWETEEQESELKKQLADFLDRRKQLDDLQKLLREEADSEQGQVQRAEVRKAVACMKLGLYRMETAEYTNTLKNYLRYFEDKKKLLPVIDQAVEKAKEQYKLSGIATEGLRISLQQYYLETLIKGEMNGQKLDDLPNEIEGMLSEEGKRYALCHSEGILGHVSCEDVKREENIPALLPTQKEFENMLLVRAGEKQLKEYKQLDLQQRQVFALSLISLGYEHMTATPFAEAGYLTDSDDMIREKNLIGQQLSDYANHKVFKPIINYEIAIQRLFVGKKEIRSDVFEEALVMTRACMQAYESKIPKDMNRLANSQESIAAAKHYVSDHVRAKLEAVPEVKDEAAFFEQLNKMCEAEKFEDAFRLKYLTLDQKALLIAVLQDRTMLDLTTGVGFLQSISGYARTYVGGAKRQEMIELLGEKKGIQTILTQADGETCTKAMQSLFSFQIKDNVNLAGRSLQKEDFADGALKRKTALDYRLLSAALDFVQELSEESQRLSYLSCADELKSVQASGSQEAVRIYKRCKDEKVKIDEERFEKLLFECARKEGQLPLYIGFMNLKKNEKELFARALCRRNILDVSNANYWSDVFGSKERDYIDPRGRNELIEEYLYHTAGNEGSVKVQKDTYKKAFIAALTTQIDDGKFIDFKKEPTYLDKRETAVDWKLIRRALQFVRRTRNEQEIFRQDRELYLSQGDLAKNGQFTFDSSYLRQNFHRSGFRGVRYLMRRLKAMGKSIADYFLGPVRKYQVVILAALPMDIRDNLNRNGVFTENKDAIETSLNLLDEYGDKFKKKDEKTGKEIGQDTAAYGSLKNFKGIRKGLKDGDYVSVATNGLELAASAERKLTKNFNTKDEGIKAIMDTLFSKEAVSLINTTIKSGVEIAKGVMTVSNLEASKKKAKAEREKDAQRAKEAAKKQNEQQKMLSEAATERNRKSMKIACTSALTQSVNKIITEMGNITAGVAATFTKAQLAGLGNIASKVITEAVGAVNFIRTWYRDTQNVKAYFMDSDEVKCAKDQLKLLKMKHNMEEFDPESISDTELLQNIMGYDNDTEIASYVGMNLVRALLFSAGPYNEVMQTKLSAVAILSAIGMSSAVGKQDKKTADAVFGALLGKEYQ